MEAEEVRSDISMNKNGHMVKSEPCLDANRNTPDSHATFK